MVFVDGKKAYSMTSIPTMTIRKKDSGENGVESIK
jgi:hypothetical protein